MHAAQSSDTTQGRTGLEAEPPPGDGRVKVGEEGRGEEGEG